jgi:hypothetical protein
VRAADTSEGNQSLWLVTAAPLVWALHFLASYATAALWCAKVVGPVDGLAGARALIGVYTAIALPGIGLIGRVGYNRHRLDGASLPHDADTPEDRHRFLGFATMLLSALSAMAVAYTAIAAAVIDRCY